MAGTLGSSGGGRAPISGINVTPMVDVVLVLLVIMMVSANYIVSQSMKVDLPTASNGESSVPTITNIIIKADGEMLLDDEPVTDEQLTSKLRAVYAQNHDLTVVITADTAAAHGKVVHAMDLAKGEGIAHFAIGVQAED